MTSPYRPEFEAALRLFARVSEAMVARGLSRPVLVGGAAVELYSVSAISTGDFDIATPSQDEFEAELRAHGFVRPSGPGVATRGWIHPELGLGFEVVTSTLLGGLADPDRVRLIEVGDAGRIALLAVEDIIADRMGQYASGTANDMLAQAQALFELYPDADMTYMNRRIEEESCGDYDVETLRNG